MNCAGENKIEDRLVDGNEGIKFGREILEKSLVEAIKTKDSDNHSEEFMQHKHGEQ